MKPNSDTIKDTCKFKKLHKFVVVVNDWANGAFVESVHDDYESAKMYVEYRWADCMNAEYSEPNASVIIYDLSKGYYLASQKEDLPGYDNLELDNYCSCDWETSIAEANESYIGIPEGQDRFYFECIYEDLGTL